jgi:hypothetical protein
MCVCALPRQPTEAGRRARCSSTTQLALVARAGGAGRTLLHADREDDGPWLSLPPLLPPLPPQYTCVFCGKTSVKRKSTGIWNCGSCKKVQTGGSYQLATAAAATVRSNLSRLRKTVEEA